MTRLVWDKESDRKVKYGIEKGVVYPKNSPGVVWNGLISVDETESDSDVAVGYYDGQAYYRERSSEGFTAKINALTMPDALYFPNTFGFSYVAGTELHLVYNAMLAANDRLYSSPKAVEDPTIAGATLITTPIKVPGLKAASHFIIDKSKTYSSVLESIESVLYGSDDFEPRLPSILELLDIFENGSLMRIIDNGDGTFTAIGPDFMVAMVDADSFRITSPSAIYLDDHTYRVSSW